MVVAGVMNHGDGEGTQEGPAVGELSKKLTGGVRNYNAVVAGVGDVDEPVFDRNARRLTG